MYIISAHRELVASDENGTLIQQKYIEEREGLTLTRVNYTPYSGQIRVTEGALAGYDIVPAGADSVHFMKNGLYLCALPNTSVLATDRTTPSIWETFRLFPAEGINNIRFHGAPHEEIDRFRGRVLQLNSDGIPVKLQFGAGFTPRVGYLNIDISPMSLEFSLNHFDDYFIFPFADMNWGIPNDSVDYIFHEDFIEHIDQIRQFQFLAEALRVMKPGCWHRVNTPNLIWTMKVRSDFSRGFEGVYTGERQWGHIQIFSHASLLEVAKTIGYAEVVFTTRNHGVSPFSEPDYRPQEDRDDIVGNIFADLQKSV